MYPTAAVSGWYFAHPHAKYFGVGKLGEDQIIALAKRKKSRKRKWKNGCSPTLITWTKPQHEDLIIK